MSKCDELKAFDVILGRYCEDGSPCIVAIDANRNPRELDEKVYLKSEADAAIAKLKQKLEDAQASAYAESVDASMRERRLRRALWLARAERAKEVKCKIKFAICAMNTKYDYSDADKWQKVEQLCRAKAEQYKEAK